jgi:7,8-dihydroneopterin aldolase/epimerase/oxygenase
MLCLPLCGGALGASCTVAQALRTVMESNRIVADHLWLEVEGLEVDVLTGVYSEETHLPQPLRISLRARLAMADHYAPKTPLSASKSYMDLKFAATDGLPKNTHFVLIESVAEHVIETILLQDAKVEEVEVKIVKLAIAQANEAIGITMRRVRK